MPTSFSQLRRLISTCLIKKDCPTSIKNDFENDSLQSLCTKKSFAFDRTEINNEQHWIDPSSNLQPVTNRSKRDTSMGICSSLRHNITRPCHRYSILQLGLSNDHLYVQCSHRDARPKYPEYQPNLYSRLY